MKYHLWRRLPIGKWFRFLRWSTQRRIGHLSPCAMMGHFGFIMAHGRRSKAYRRLRIGRGSFRRKERVGTTAPRSFGWHSDVGLIDQRIVPRPKLQGLTLLPRTMTETRCDQIGTWKLIRRRPTLALTKSECLRKSSPYRRPYISRPASLLS